MRQWTTWCGVMLAWLVAAMPAWALTLVEGGQSRHQIVTVSAPDPTEAHAARLLADYLHKATGATLPIVPLADAAASPRLLVGQAAIAAHPSLQAVVGQLDAQALLVRRIGEDVVLVGGSPQGTLYAVVDFLERHVGVRWLNWYGEVHVPSLAKLTLPDALDRQDAPVVAVRDMLVSANLTWISDIRTGQGGQAFRDFLAYNRGSGPELSYFELGYYLYPGGLSMAGHGGLSHTYTNNPPYFVHTFFMFVSPKDHFAAHPAYFSEVNGQRTPEQLCLSHPDVRRLIRDKVAAHLDEKGGPDVRGVVSISPEDNHVVCGCAACEAIDTQYQARGASIIHGVADITRSLARDYPHVTITTLGYAGTEEPPVGMALPENLVIVFAPFHGLKEDRLIGWSKIAHQIWIWYYPNSYASPLPRGILRKMAEDFRFFKRHGVTGYSPIEQDAPGVYDSLHLVDLQNWVIMKLMWDPHQPVEALIDDFTRHYYGPAARFIRQYAMGLENHPSGDKLEGRDIVRYQKWLDEAERAVADDPLHRPRVQLARLGLDRATVLFWDRVTQAGPPPFTLEEVSQRFRERYPMALARIPYPEQRKAMERGRVGGLHQPYVGTGFLDRALIVQKALANKPTQPPVRPEAARSEQIFTIPAVQDSQMIRHQLNKWIAFVDDPLAHGGQAARIDSKGFQMGFYDGNQSHSTRGLAPSQITQGKYAWYHVHRGLLKPGDYVFADATWYVQFHDIQKFIEADNPGQWWDIWLSIRFEGPAYDPQAPADAPNRYAIDRLTLIKLD